MKSTISTNVALSGENLESFPITIAQGGHGRIAALCRRGLYRYPYYIALMETVANAVDSHIQFGAERPVEISLNPCTLEVSVRDFGPGVSRDEAKKHLFSYGSSTRSNDNLCVGGFGIGAKAPLCAVERMTVISRNGGIKTTYECLDDGLGGKVRVVSEEPTEEPSGLEVSYNLMESFVKKDEKGNPNGYWLESEGRYQFLTTMSLWFQLIGLGEGPGRRVMLKSWMFEMVPNPYKEFVALIPSLQKIRDQLAEDGWYIPRLEVDQIPASLLPSSLLFAGSDDNNRMFRDSGLNVCSILVSNGVHLYDTGVVKTSVGSSLNLPMRGLWSGCPTVKVTGVAGIKVTADRESGTCLQELEDPRKNRKKFPLLDGDNEKAISLWLKQVTGTPMEKMLKLHLMEPIVSSFIPELNIGFSRTTFENLFKNSSSRVPYSERMRENREFTISGSEQVGAGTEELHLHCLVWDKEYPKNDGFYDQHRNEIAGKIMNGLEPEWLEMMRKLNKSYRVHVFVSSKKTAAGILEDEIENFDPKTQFVRQVSFELAESLIQRLNSDTVRDSSGSSSKMMYYTLSTEHLEGEDCDVLMERLFSYINGLKDNRKDPDWRYSLTVISRVLSKLKLTSKTDIRQLKESQGKIAVITNSNWTSFPALILMIAHCLQNSIQIPFHGLLIADGYSEKDLKVSKELSKAQMSLSVDKAITLFEERAYRAIGHDMCDRMRSMLEKGRTTNDVNQFVRGALTLNCTTQLLEFSHLSSSPIRYGIPTDQVKSWIHGKMKRFCELFSDAIHKSPSVCKDYILLNAWRKWRGALLPQSTGYTSLICFKIPERQKENYDAAFVRITALLLKLVDKLEKESTK